MDRASAKLLAALAVTIVFIGLAALRYRPPPARPADPPAPDFSAGRARGGVRAVLGAGGARGGGGGGGSRIRPDRRPALASGSACSPSWTGSGTNRGSRRRSPADR